LLAFQRGEGWYIDNRSIVCYNSNAKMIEDGEKQFREKLSNQIHGLIGQKPRVALSNNSYAIFYS